MNLLPCPRTLKRGGGILLLGNTLVLRFEGPVPSGMAAVLVRRLRFDDKKPGFRIVQKNSRSTVIRNDRARQSRLVLSWVSPSDSAFPANPEAYSLIINAQGIGIRARNPGGVYAAVATLRQLLREHGRRLPFLEIEDWPDFPRRGVMLDISRGRVPRLETLLELVGHLADFKINEFQLYTEHTFAYRNYRSVWRDWGALSGADIEKLDARCRELGIDLVPNQNSFGHLRHLLASPRLRHLAEVAAPYEGATGAFLRYPSTLAPNHPGSIQLLRELYDELLPHFSSQFFNVGCDETWDLGRGMSSELCRRQGKGKVYLNFLKRVYREVSQRGRRMMFWGDIILHHPKLIHELPKNVIALNWGYEAGHPFDREAGRFARAGVPFYVCPGTSTWMTLIGKQDNALANLRTAALAGRRHGAIGYLITDWGDGGHPQPLAVSYLPYLTGAAMAWCAETFDRRQLIPVLSREVFGDSTTKAARAALDLGLAHRRLKHTLVNGTAIGSAIAAPLPESRELFCWDGSKHHARISKKALAAARPTAPSHAFSSARAFSWIRARNCVWRSALHF